MSITGVALLVGVVFGVLAGGRPSNVGRRRVELLWLLVISAALQIGAEVLDLPDRVGLAMVLVSYVGLAAFAIANTRLVGMPVVLVGVLCNLAVITANGGMPVEDDALVASGAVTRAEIASIDLGAKRHLATDGDSLRILGDVIPLKATREVLSFGDLILAFGMADVVFRLLKPVELRRREEDDLLLPEPAIAERPVPRQLVDA